MQIPMHTYIHHNFALQSPSFTLPYIPTYSPRHNFTFSIPLAHSVPPQIHFLHYLPHSISALTAFKFSLSSSSFLTSGYIHQHITIITI